MVGNGAAGKTKIEMQQVSGTTGLSFSDINAANRDIARSLGSGNNPNVILTTANAIWYRQDAQVKATFIATNQQFYGATVDALDSCGLPRHADANNGWWRKTTNGKIQRLADGMIRPLTPGCFWPMPFISRASGPRRFGRCTRRIGHFICEVAERR